MKDLIDPDDYCRQCGGRGLEYERTERNTTLSTPCYQCRGTGSRTVRVGEGMTP